MNLKDLKRKLDPKARYIWAKDTPYSWRLVNEVTMKTAYGCEDRLTAEMLTRKLRGARYSVGDVPRTIEELAI